MGSHLPHTASQQANARQTNIAEGSRAAATSSQTELRLTNVARSSLEELLLDFEDYLRHRRLPAWSRESPEALAVRQVPRQYKQDRTDLSDLTDLTEAERWTLYARWLEHGDPAVRANAIICLIHQANYLLDQQIAALERAFITDGGYSEQLASARVAHRSRKDQPPQSGPSDHIPACPKCGKPTVVRTAKTGKNAGKQFWGCTAYPDCRGVVSL